VLDVLVLVKITVDTAELKTDPLDRRPRLDDAPLRLSTFDEHALEAAIQLVERRGGSVKALSLGASEPPQELLLRILAMGADEAILVLDPGGSEEPLRTASLLAAAVRRLAPWDLILCGDGSLDHYHRQTGPRLGEELGVPALTQITGIEADGDRLVLRRSLEYGTEIVEVVPPAVLAVGQEINTPRLPAVSKILKAARKPVTRWTAGDLEPAISPLTGEPGMLTLEMFAPPATRKGIAVDGDTPGEVAATLLRTLLAEGVLRT